MFDGIFINLNAITVFAVVLGGFSLGLYFGALNKFAKAQNLVAGIVSFLVIGYSFYIPFMFASLATNATGDPLRFVGSMVLWTLFTLAATGSYSLAAVLAAAQRK